ncbi:MAG: DNA primase [Candidatus Dependentiae bacterium]|nr:DNA primase [Candidatus Dependentiae bacterium]
MSLFNFIKSQVAILDVIQEHTTLKKNGSYWKGCCPFHHEKTASFTVSPHKEIFYCFGCHVTGDVITFVEKIEQCSPLEAAHYLAQRFNILIPEKFTKDTDSAPTQQSRDLYFTLCKLVAEWSQNNLQKNPFLINYLEQRGFTPLIINQFSLGYFPGGPTSIKLFLDHMRTHTVLAQDLLEAHIIAQGKTSLYSPFEERIIFPIKDHLGRFCGFGGRIFKPHDDRPKYYNSKENEFFTKGSLLFGLDHAKKSMQDSGIVFLVEGYTDCMAMVQHGFANTIATLGTACTTQHLKTVSRYVQQVYVLYDNDKAGQQAVARLTQLCWHVDLELKVIELPEGQDPASWLEHNTMQPLIHKAKDIFVFFIDTLGKDFATKLIPEKVRLTRIVVDIIRTLDDPLKQDFLLQKAAQSFEIPFQSLKNELSRNDKQVVSAEQDNNSSIETKNNITQSIDDISKLEKQIFCAILSNTHLLNNFNMKYTLEYLPEQLQAVLYQLSGMYTKNEQTTFNDFFCSLSINEKQWISKLLLEHTESVEPHFEQLVYQLQKVHWKKITRDIKQQIADANHAGNATEVAKLLQDFLCLKKQIMPHTA